MLCLSCGREWPDPTEECRHCGARLTPVIWTDLVKARRLTMPAREDREKEGPAKE